MQTARYLEISHHPANWQRRSFWGSLFCFISIFNFHFYLSLDRPILPYRACMVSSHHATRTHHATRCMRRPRAYSGSLFHFSLLGFNVHFTVCLEIWYLSQYCSARLQGRSSIAADWCAEIGLLPRFAPACSFPYSFPCSFCFHSYYILCLNLKVEPLGNLWEPLWTSRVLWTSIRCWNALRSCLSLSLSPPPLPPLLGVLNPCMHVCTCMYLYMYVCMYTHACMPACTRIRHACMRAYVIRHESSLYGRVLARLWMYVCKCVCVYVCMCVCVYVIVQRDRWWESEREWESEGGREREWAREREK